MEIVKWLKKTLLLTAILLITFFPMLTPAVYAVSSWTGESWEGESWEGESWDGSPWDGSNLEWQGETWQGDTWEGNGTEGPAPGNGAGGNYDWSHIPWYLEGWYADGWSQDGYSGNLWSQSGFDGNGTTGDSWRQDGFNGNETNGSPWMQDGFQGEGYTGNPWSQGGYQGNPYNGDPWSGNGYLGSPYVGNPWLQNGFNGSGTYGPGTDGNSTNGNGTDADPADVMKYVTTDVMGGTASVIEGGFRHQRFQDVGRTGSGWGLTANNAYAGMLVNGLKLAGVDSRVTDAGEAFVNSTEAAKGYRDIRSGRQFGNTPIEGRDISGGSSSAVSSTPSKPGGIERALSKFNVATAAVGTAYSGFETYNSWQNASDIMDSDASGAQKTSAAAEVGENAGIIHL